MQDGMHTIILDGYIRSINHNIDSRMNMNKFYTSVLTALIAAWGLVSRSGNYSDKIFEVIIGLVGISMCMAWVMGIRSYRSIGSAKFVALRGMISDSENPYDKEWNILREKNSGYISIGVIESVVPYVLMVVYVVIAVN